MEKSTFTAMPKLVPNFVGQVRGKDDAIYQRFRQGLGVKKATE